MDSSIFNFAKLRHVLKESANTAISINEVVKLAKLARITLSEAEKIEYVDELEKVINWLNKLDHINTDSVEKVIHSESTEVEEIATNKAGGDHSDVLRNINTEHGCFVVPKVIED